MTASILNVQNLSKVVPSAEGELTILDRIDFDLARGASLAIVGSSGSGKSTLLGLLAGLDIPTRGDIVYGILDVGAKVVIGDLIESTDDGTLRKLTTGSSASDGGAVVGIALEALDLTGSGAVATHIKVRIK